MHLNTWYKSIFTHTWISSPIGIRYFQTAKSWPHLRCLFSNNHLAIHGFMAGSRAKRRNPNPGLIGPAPGLHNDLISWDVQILLDGGLSVAARLILNLTMMTHNRHNLGFLSELERLLWSWLLVWRLQNLSTTHQWALQPGILMFDGLLSKLLRIVPYQNCWSFTYIRSCSSQQSWEFQKFPSSKDDLQKTHEHPWKPTCVINQFHVFFFQFSCFIPTLISLLKSNVHALASSAAYSLSW